VSGQRRAEGCNPFGIISEAAFPVWLASQDADKFLTQGTRQLRVSSGEWRIERMYSSFGIRPSSFRGPRSVNAASCKPPAWQGNSGKTAASSVIHLDHNATTPLAPDVREVMLPYLVEEWGNPSSSYRFGAKLKGVIEATRGQVAEIIGASAREIIFTSGATEANNTAPHAALNAD
jgi:hypothetical protein